MIRVYGNKTATMQFPEQTLPIRNERVISSNLISGSPLFEGRYLLKLTYLGVLADATEGSFKTHKGEPASQSD
jgi:hypothetical protein